MCTKVRGPLWRTMIHSFLKAAYSSNATYEELSQENGSINRAGTHSYVEVTRYSPYSIAKSHSQALNIL